MISAAADEPHIDDAGGCIWRGGARFAVAPKAFAVLRRLRQHPKQLVSKGDLLDAGWPDTHVIDVVLNNAIAQLRHALGDDPKQPRFIETVPRRGFRWIGPAMAVAPGAPPEDEASAFVGRADTIAELERCYARAATGRRQLVFVTGEPGIGKTRVVSELIAGSFANARGLEPAALVAWGQCVEQLGVVESYRPVLEAMSALVRTAGIETRAVFAKHAPTWLLQMPELSSTAELDKLRTTVTASTSERTQRELEAAIAAACVDRLLVFVLEDLHWSDHATVGLLWALATSREPGRLLIIGTYRPVDAIAAQHPIIRLRHELASQGRCRELALEGLDAAAVGALLDQRFPNHQFPHGFADRLHEQTSGNPLFLLNALADFEQRGWLRERGGVWQCTFDLDALDAAVPETTRELVAFRLEQLPAATLELLEAASIVGMTFTTQAVGAAAERAAAEVEEECGRLARGALFLHGGLDIEWPDGSRGRRHTFRHALYRQMLSARVTPTRRQLLHRRIAARLESGYGDRAPGVAAQLSSHHEHAGDLLRASEWLEIAARQAHARFANKDAETLLAHAVTLLQGLADSPPRQERLFRMTSALSLALDASYGPGSAPAAQAFEDARALGQSIPTSTEHILSLASLAIGEMNRGELRAAHGLGEQMLALAGEDGPPLARMTAHMTSGAALFVIGDIHSALRHLRGAAELADVLRGTPGASAPMFNELLVALESLLGTSLVLAGAPEEGTARIDAGIARARALDNSWLLVAGLSQASHTAVILRNLDLAHNVTSEFLAHCEAWALPLHTEIARVERGWLAVHETADPGLLEPLRHAVDDFLRLGQVHGARLLSLLADACLTVGRFDEASTALDRASEVRGQDQFYDVELLRQRAAVSLARAEKRRSRRVHLEEAEALLARAIELSVEQGNRWFGLRATVDLCRLWFHNAKRDQARERLTHMLAGFTEGLTTVDLRVAHELLHTVRGSGSG